MTVDFVKLENNFSIPRNENYIHSIAIIVKANACIVKCMALITMHFLKSCGVNK